MLKGVTLWNGKPVPPNALARLQQQFLRLQDLETEIATLEKERRDRIRREDSPQARQVRKLLGLKAIGTTSSWFLVNEVFG